MKDFHQSFGINSYSVICKNRKVLDRGEYIEV